MHSVSSLLSSGYEHGKTGRRHNNQV